ncbi:hypothetical protein C482_06182 [Natrialba chahannaoensis JCM 10990]|uniref:Uncharacterized protein n=1 Tax=Natrialba chahannaoensis JCM 10990 TaxID=1227492 RepID=M0ATG9_9EURY|nr:hypothetical protein [Natrialba chahannaoensis]ELZ01617.1 hypothetical protein C482_06182 [Natrialba chahannaoensis JCM 10990]
MSFDSTDFGDLADHVRTQSADAPGSDTERVTIRSLESLDTDALADLLEMAETEHDRPADLVFVLPQPPADLAADASPEALEDALGRTVRVDSSAGTPTHDAETDTTHDGRYRRLTAFQRPRLNSA